MFLRSYFLAILVLPFYTNVFADSSKYNFYNNHGMIGLINMPTARFYDEASHGITIYSGTPDQKITFTASPYDWLEASFFYTNINGKPYCASTFDPVCAQDYKDKGFNFKLRLKEEGFLPAVAIGINDMAGVALYSSEYIVASYGINRFDFHFGLGFGALNGSKHSFKNPLIYLGNNFADRPDYKVGYVYDDKGGSFHPKRYFSGKETSPFFGLTFAPSKKLVLKLELDTTLTPGEIGYEDSDNEFSYGFDLIINDSFSLGLSQERNSYTSLKFIYKNNPTKRTNSYTYVPAEVKSNWNNYTKLIANLENNGIGVNKITESADSIGLELTQFTHSNIEIIEEIILSAKLDSGITKNLRKDLRIANLKALSEYDQSFERNTKLIYERESRRKFNTNTKLSFIPFLASREEFFKGSIVLENNSEYIIKDNFFFTSNLKYSLADNLDDFYIPARDTYPAQVRSDIKEYLKDFDQGIKIGRAQFDYYLSLSKSDHLMFTAGILEDMFSGYGFEYLYFKEKSNYAFGLEMFEVVKRDYGMQFGTLNYKNTTGSINFYYRNFDIIPFDAKISYGEYLAGDEGVTFELSRSFMSGIEFGVFATFTDVSTDQFGEGSFDKGIFFNIPIYGNLINYTWKPLTKDPGAKLNRKNSLHDLLVKFRPIYN